MDFAWLPGADFNLFRSCVFLGILRETKTAATPAERVGTAGGFVTAADHRDFHHVGYFVEPAGWKRDYISFLLSTDRMALAMIVHGVAARIRLSSRLSDGRWLVTNQKPGEADFSGLRIEAQWPGEFGELLAFHNRRLAEMSVALVPFDPQYVLDNLLGHNRMRAGVLVRMGLARWRNKEETAWSYTLRGSIRLSSQSLKDVRAGMQMKKEVDKGRLPTL
jgi:hypothetical protein